MCGLNGIFAYHSAAGMPDRDRALGHARSHARAGAGWRGKVVERRSPLWSCASPADDPGSVGSRVPAHDQRRWRLGGCVQWRDLQLPGIACRAGGQGSPVSDDLGYRGASAPLCARRHRDGASAARNVRIRHLGRAAARSVPRARSLRDKAVIHRQ